MYCTRIEDVAQFTDATNIRKEVFINEQGVSELGEFDHFDDLNHKKCIHFALIEKNKVIGTFRMINSTDYIKISRVALLKEYRNNGYMSNALNEIIDEFIESNTFNVRNKYFYLESQLHAIDFYKNIGFIEYGDVFVDEGIEHKKMKLNTM